MTFAQGAALALLGGGLALERTAFFQGMASRPLVACTLAGTLLGEAALGLRCGLLLELLWLMELPVGASVPPEESLVAVLAAAYASLAPPEWDLNARAAAGALAALPLGSVGRWVDMAVRRGNAGLLAQAREPGGDRRVGRLHLTGAVRFFAAGVLAAGVGLLAGGPAVRAVLEALPEGAEATLGAVGSLLPLVGAAVVLAALPGRRAAALFAVGVAAWLAALWRLPAQGRWRP